MALNILILQQMPIWTNGSIYNLLSKFVGIMSFDITTYQESKGAGRCFGPISTITSHIAKVVWCSRLWGLEYTLPAREYQFNGWLAVAAYKNPLVRLKEFRDQYLCLGTSSAVGMTTIPYIEFLALFPIPSFAS